MKRISLVLGILGLSTSALAAYPAATDPTIVTIPLMPGGFFVGVSAYYLQPSQTNGAYENLAVPAGTPASFSSSFLTIDPGYDWGWGVNAGYIFPNTGNDVQLSYFNYDSSDSNSLASPFTLIAGPFSLTTLSSTHKVENDIDQVDLTAGQFVDVGCRLIMHPFTGLRWAEIDQKRTRAEHLFLDLDELGTFDDLLNETNKSDYQGIGPIVGADASYYLGWGFGAVGHFDSAVLVGTIDDSSHGTTVVRTPAGTVLSIGFTDNGSDDLTRVVPVIDAKLGLDYTYLFYNTANSDLTLEVGWQFTKYFNAVETIPGLILTSPTTRTTANLALQGPYASLVLHI